MARQPNLPRQQSLMSFRLARGLAFVSLFARINLLQAFRRFPICRIALFTLLAVSARLRAEDRTFDGTGNNLLNPLWGSAGTDYTREASGAHYADGISAPQVAGLPSARDVSNSLMTQGENSVLDPRALTAMVYTWGQFIDHDMDLR